MGTISRKVTDVPNRVNRKLDTYESPKKKSMVKVIRIGRNNNRFALLNAVKTSSMGI